MAIEGKTVEFSDDTSHARIDWIWAKMPRDKRIQAKPGGLDKTRRSESDAITDKANKIASKTPAKNSRY
jgi:hypothetical protein